MRIGVDLGGTKTEALAQATTAVAEQRLITAHDSHDLQEANLLALALLAQASAESKEELAHLEEAQQIAEAASRSTALPSLQRQHLS